MDARFAEVRAGRSDIADALSAARSARNRATRDGAAQATEDRALVRHHKSKRARDDRDLERASRIRIQMPEPERPRLGGRTPRKLFHRLGGQVMRNVTGSAGGGTGPATRSIHFAVVARGFASRTGRRWRAGEGERAALYIVREEGLEGGEAGWWSNIAEDRNELAAFHRASEALEKHDRKNANVYVTEIIALDASLSARQRRKAVRRYCRYFEKRGLPFTVAMHAPDVQGDQRNYHCHIIYSLRPAKRLAPYDWSFAASKVADVNTPDGIRERRGLIVDALNMTLIAASKPRRYTPLSNSARGLSPGAPKLGQKATWAARRADAEEIRSATLERLGGAVSGIRTGLRSVATARALDNRMAPSLTRLRDAISARSLQLDARMTSLRDTIVTRLRAMAPALPARTRVGLDIAWLNVKGEVSMAAERLPLPSTIRDRIGAAGIVAAGREHRRGALEAARSRITQPLRDSGPVRLDTVMRLADRYRAVTAVRATQDAAMAAVRTRLEYRLRNLRPALHQKEAERLDQIGQRLFRRRRLEAMRGAVEQHLKTMAALRVLVGRTGTSLNAAVGRIRHGIDTHAHRLNAVAQLVADRQADAMERRPAPAMETPAKDEASIQTASASPSGMSHGDAIAHLRELALQRAQKDAQRKKVAGPKAAASPDIVTEAGGGTDVERASAAASLAKDVQSGPGGLTREPQTATPKPQPMAPSDGKPKGPADRDYDPPWWQDPPGRGGNER